MRQAIEERFILDVLKHYTTYKTYYKLSKVIEDDPEVDEKKAKKAIARFMSLHPHNIAQKIEIIVEHYRKFTNSKINGKAKAMVVTVFFKPQAKHTKWDHGQFNKWIDPAVARFNQEYVDPNAISEEGEAFKSTLQTYIRLYSFLSQVIDWQDVELEKLYAYGRY